MIVAPDVLQHEIAEGVIAVERDAGLLVKDDARLWIGFAGVRTLQVNL